MAKTEQELAATVSSPAPKKKLKIDNKQVFYYLLMVFPLVQFCIFYIGVNFQSILLAFQKYENSQFVFLTEDIFANFKQIIYNCVEETTVLTAFKNSIILWFFTTVCGTGIAIFFSYYIFKCKGSGRFFRFILFLPSILPAILLTIIFKLFTSDVLPAVFGIEKLLESTDPSVRLTTIIGYTVFMGFGTQVLLYSNAMEQISPSILEAAELDGAESLVELWHIILPQIMGTVSTFLIATIAGAFTNQANIFNFYGEDAFDYSQTNTLGYYMFVLVQPNSKLGFGRAYYGYASALGLCCTVLALVPTILFRNFSKRFEE